MNFAMLLNGDLFAGENISRTKSEKWKPDVSVQLKFLVSFDYMKIMKF